MILTIKRRVRARAKRQMNNKQVIMKLCNHHKKITNNPPAVQRMSRIRYTDFLHLWNAVSSSYPSARKFEFPAKDAVFIPRGVFSGESVEDFRRKKFTKFLALLVSESGGVA